MKSQYKTGYFNFGFLIIGCYEDVISPERDPDGLPQSVSFKNDLAPLLKAKCTAVGCHVKWSTQTPIWKMKVYHSEI